MTRKPAITLLFLMAGFHAFAQIPFDTIYKNDDSYEVSELINYKANFILNKQFEDATEIDNDYFIVKKNGKYGVYNETAKSIYAEVKYDTITPIGNFLLNGKWGNLLYGEELSKLILEHPRGVVFIKDKKYGVKKISGETILKAEYDEIIPQSYGLFFFRKKDKWGFINADKDKSLVKPKFDHMVAYTDFDTQYPTVIAYSNKVQTKYTIYGQPAGKKQKRAKQQRIIKRYYGFVQGYWFSGWKPATFFFTDGKKNGVKDPAGNVIIPAKYDMINPLMDGNYIVSQDTLHGMLDSKGQIIIPLIYSGIGPVKGDALKDNLFYVYKQNVSSVFDARGNQLYPFEILSSEGSMPLNEDYSKVCFQIVENKVLEKKKELDEYGEPVFDSDIYSKALLLYENGKITKVLGGCTDIKYIDHPDSYTVVYTVYGSPLFGFYSEETGKKTDAVYKKYLPVGNGRIVAMKGEKYDTLLDENLTATPLDIEVTGYKDGYYLVKDSSGMKVMDENHTVSKFAYPKLEFLSNTDRGSYIAPELKAAYSRVFKFYDWSGKCGLIDADGKILFPADTYDDISIALRTADDPYPTADRMKAIGKYLDRIMVAKTYKGDTAETDLYFEGEKIASFNVYKNWQLKYSDITQNNQLIIRYPNIRVYNLLTQKTDLEVKANNFSEDTDGGFTVIEEYGKRRGIEKYSTSGKLLSIIAIPKEGLYSYEKSKLEYIHKQNGKYGLVNVKGEMVSPFLNDTLSTYDYLYYIATRGTKMGIITKESVAIPFEYDAITYYPYNWMNTEKGVYILKKNGKFGVADKDAKILLPAEYDTAFAKGEFIIANKGNVFSVMDRSGKLLFNLDCDTLEAYTMELLYFTKNGKQGIVRNDGKTLMAALYNQFEQLGKDIYIVTDGDAKYLTNDKGEKVLNLPLQSANTITSDYKPFDITEDYLVLQNTGGKYGLYSLDMKELLPFEYDDISEVVNFKYVILKKNGHVGVVTTENKTVIPFKYDYINFREYEDYFEADAGKANYLIAPNGIILQEELDD
ncbi:hypothetical protein HYN59_13955 [Flavobacterium album]|uniref:WG repeat-containing protein n=1 Tax=Flavobacterium album TaxID=2175091 RepID=A0A2S1R0J9_9FLAO|nr:WG repeat-containing protein [Flavobacterium album]AWH86145.1 hypothetical protein HYN59_13955 [Flavobacterium album]